jgi:hypothetical protein
MLQRRGKSEETAALLPINQYIIVLLAMVPPIDPLPFSAAATGLLKPYAFAAVADIAPGDAFRAKFNVFRNDLDNYINLKFLGPLQGVGGQRCLNFTVFFCEQYQNIPTAWIEGVEFESNYDVGSWFAGVAASHLPGEPRKMRAPSR